MIYEIQLTKRNTLLYKSISLSFYSRKGHNSLLYSLRDRWRDIYSERGFLLAPISSSWSQGVPTLAPPLISRIVRDNSNASDRLRIPGSTLDSNWTACLNLTAWFSYHVVSFRLHTCSTGLPRRSAIPLFTNHNVTACQSTLGHQERTQNPCQQSLYSIL